ncbi:Hypothetical predicted protein [Octopus vulgaris]|uniref:Selenoprotein K n=1 Tax=Octopus vulgaris TaxID=6645 RepID=A0AA36C2N7_OCTVU|nr:Hypothetical predicted protein [Octopus vulgaris]
MVYVSEGNIVSSRSPWRLSIIPEVLYALMGVIILFFKTLISPNSTQHDSSGSYRSDGRGPPPPPRRRMGRLNFDGDTPGPPPMSGGG